MEIVDPACGSGSFLLGAYQYLLNWHKDYYAKNPNKKNTTTPDGNLTTTEKKRILLNNIYGVDTNKYFSLDSTHVMHLLDKSINLKYILGLYNSSLLNFIYQSKVNEGGRVFA